ncbi:MAG: hypothetical protein FWC45_08465 [Treponema sp.]|nr:hypothetical protein [Treponema sp.]
MKNLQITGLAFVIALLLVPALEAQSTLRGMSLNGSTGLYSIPSGRTGWEKSSSFGLDLGYHAIIRGGAATNIPKISMSLFKFMELSAALDVQPNGYITPDKGTDFIGGIKFQLPIASSAIALGGNFQTLNAGIYNYNAGQIYAAVTYAGQLFNMPAETSVVLGKTFKEKNTNWDIDFGMGFDLILLPRQLGRFVHWVSDFANFSYSVEAFGADALYRGVFNTGLRIDLSAIPDLSKFKFVIDVFVTDVLDKGRAFSLGAVFGVPVL